MLRVLLVLLSQVLSATNTNTKYKYKKYYPPKNIEKQIPKEKNFFKKKLQHLLTGPEGPHCCSQRLQPSAGARKKASGNFSSVFKTEFQCYQSYCDLSITRESVSQSWYGGMRGDLAWRTGGLSKLIADYWTTLSSEQFTTYSGLAMISITGQLWRTD